jgi:hypothetical protein
MATIPFPTCIPAFNQPTVSPEIEVLLLSGSVDSDTANNINSTTPIVTGKEVFNGISAAPTTWGDEDIFPITAPNNTIKTIIEITGYPVISGGDTTNENSGKGTIQIDWLTGKVVGRLTYRQGGLDTMTITDVMLGDLMSIDPIISTTLDTTYLASTTRSVLIADLGAKTISALPLYPRPVTENQCVHYTITHYKAAVISGYQGLAGYTSFISVSSLPIPTEFESPQGGTCYLLTAADPVAFAPPGLYMWHTGVGWSCITAFTEFAFDSSLPQSSAGPSWVDAVSLNLISNVPYRAVIAPEGVTSIALTIQTQGALHILGQNPTGYTVPTNPTGCYGIGVEYIADAYLGLRNNVTMWNLYHARIGDVYFGDCQALVQEVAP